ncbi:carbamoyltransferase family protein [Haloferax larsenii]|uniref:Carbamoyltransferase n=1 Tax=Haloferax larsenii TaxID=302484 RepID=A0A1H7JMV3_HALLR|nr:carbamoyltransferase C-terminal domain-containing protein [Haloferax larsenii]SEK74795.1 carbamoyltransferase [Haloferax larsenii]
MESYVLSFKPAIPPYGTHDPSAALFKNGELLFGSEEERHTREKHAVKCFPENAIRACLDFADISLSDVDQIVLPYNPSLNTKRLGSDLKRVLSNGESTLVKTYDVFYQLKKHCLARTAPDIELRDKLEAIDTPVPPIHHQPHHRCHAASAFHPTDFEEAIVLTIDGQGEYDSTVVWRANTSGLERLKTYEYPNSIGHFFGVITEYLGYHAFNGEGKIMGLAPYGRENSNIESALRSLADFGRDYDVTPLTSGGIDAGVHRLESALDRPRNEEHSDIDQFYKDVAYIAQKLLEETVTEIVEEYTERFDIHSVGLAGGVALNCKMNKRVNELDSVDELFIQPVAHDAGLALGAGWLTTNPAGVSPMNSVYWGVGLDDSEIEALLKTNKIEYERHDEVERYIAEQLADGQLVGWMQGRQEMGPRALGNRSILADPRTVESLNRVNEYVKHREKWRPFAPSLLEEAADEYLVDATRSPYMIKTFDTVEDKRDEISAVIHPADKTTRPQTVREDQNPRYYRLISEFSDITGVPVVLNTSFNDHAEPIVTKPVEALRDFYGMGLDILVIGDYVVEK